MWPCSWLCMASLPKFARSLNPLEQCWAPTCAAACDTRATMGSVHSSACVMWRFGIASSITGTHWRVLRMTMTSSSSWRTSPGCRLAMISQKTQYLLARVCLPRYRALRLHGPPCSGLLPLSR